MTDSDVDDTIKKSAYADSTTASTICSPTMSESKFYTILNQPQDFTIAISNLSKDNTDNTSNTYNCTRKHNGPRRGQPKNPLDLTKNLHYFWNHGRCRNSSQSCNDKEPDHVDDKTFTDRKNGSNYGLH